MTNEERQKLCDELSHAANRTDRHGYYGPLCGKAADEIERLAALAQSDAEPVEPRVTLDEIEAAMDRVLKRLIPNPPK